MEKDIYIVLSFTGTVLSRLIRKATKDSYSHSSICLDGNFENMYSFGRKHPSNPIFAGLVTENLFDGVFKNFKNSQCLIYKIKVTQEQYDKLNILIDEFMSEQKKYKYNILGIIALKFNKSFKTEYHYFCSQFVYELLNESKIFNLNKESETVKPLELLSIPDKVFVFEGRISDFKELLESTESEQKRILI